MVRDSHSKEPNARLTLEISDRLKNKGFLTSYSGKYNNVLKIRPPLVFSRENAESFLDAFDECMAELGDSIS